MKLSEAMRLGAMIRPQGFGDYYEPHIVNERVMLPDDPRFGAFNGGHLIDIPPPYATRPVLQLRSCAMGAALEAVGRLTPEKWRSMRLTHEMPPAWPEEWDPTAEHTCACPECGIVEHLRAGTLENEPCTVGWLAAHLNDRHLWTRERIAAWVQGIEATLDGPAAEGAQQAIEDPEAECLVCV